MAIHATTEQHYQGAPLDQWDAIRILENAKNHLVETSDVWTEELEAAQQKMTTAQHVLRRAATRKVVR